jgi:hypothetical protein
LERGGDKGLPPDKTPQPYGAGRILRLPYWDKPMLDLGIQATRSMAVDLSRKSGAPLLLAFVERVEVPKAMEKGEVSVPGESEETKAFRAMFQQKMDSGPSQPPPQAAPPPTTWVLPFEEAVGPAIIEGNRFRLAWIPTGGNAINIFWGERVLLELYTPRVIQR